MICFSDAFWIWIAFGKFHHTCHSLPFIVNINFIWIRPFRQPYHDVPRTHFWTNQYRAAHEAVLDSEYLQHSPHMHGLASIIVACEQLAMFTISLIIWEFIRLCSFILMLISCMLWWNLHTQVSRWDFFGCITQKVLNMKCTYWHFHFDI